MTTTVTIPLSFKTPPLNLNQRNHWARDAKIRKQLREEVFLRCLSMKIRRPAKFVKVEFHYRPRLDLRRDTDNIQPTVKSLCDGLGPRTKGSAGYALVPDDTPEFMARPEPVIHKSDRDAGAACWLVLHIEYEETK